MFGDNVVVCDWFDHLDVEFLFSVCESWLEDYEEIGSVFIFEGDSLCEGRHFARSQVDPGLDLTSPVTEGEHIGVVLPPKVF